MTPVQPAEPAASEAGPAAPPRSVFSSYLELAKPRLSLLVMATVLTGFLMGRPDGPLDTERLLKVMLGVCMAVAGGAALNQVIERKADARMARTRNRPLATGAISMHKAMALGLMCSCFGMAFLYVWLPQVVGHLCALAWAVYVLFYTPLKFQTPLNTLVGAIPGALPPLMGHAAAHGSLELGGGVLFVILFVWQLAHFPVIAYFYREDYERAGMKMISGMDDEQGTLVARHSLLATLMLVPASLLPSLVDMSGEWYFVAATLLGIMMLVSVIALVRAPSRTGARRVFITSLIYLPLLLAAMIADKY